MTLSNNINRRVGALVTALAAALLLLSLLSLLVPTTIAAPQDEFRIVCPPDGGLTALTLNTYINLANSNAGPDTVIISPTDKACRFRLTSYHDDYGAGPVATALIADELVIRALGKGAILYRDNHQNDAYRILESIANLTLENVTIADGQLVNLRGGGIYAHAPLTLTNVVITGNEAAGGAGVYAASNVVMDNVKVSNNIGDIHSEVDAQGGGLWIEGDLEATAITVTNNVAGFNNNGNYSAPGGGIYVGGDASIYDAFFEGNASVRDSGGGLYVNRDLTISNSRFYTNSAGFFGGGGIFVNGSLTLSNSEFAHNEASNGGGVYARNGLVIEVTNATFSHNIAGNRGGGLTSIRDAVINDSHFADNEAQSGGGAFLDSGIVTNSVFTANVALGTGQQYGGGGLAVNHNATIQNNLFLQNAATHGGGVYIRAEPPVTRPSVIVNNLWLDNDAAQGAGFYSGVENSDSSDVEAEIGHNTIARHTFSTVSAIEIATGNANVRNNILAHHTVGVKAIGDADVISDYSLYYLTITNQEGVSGGEHNLDGDPLFVAPELGDYHLQSDSPARDSGETVDVVQDLEGVARPQGNGFDRGAFELIPSNAPPIATADAYDTMAATPLNVPVPGVLHNDDDPDGDDITALPVTGPANGTVNLQPDGSFTYVPDPGFSGNDSFTYQVTDGELESQPVSVTIVVSERQKDLNHNNYLPALLAR